MRGFESLVGSVVEVEDVASIWDLNERVVGLRVKSCSLGNQIQIALAAVRLSSNLRKRNSAEDLILVASNHLNRPGVIIGNIRGENSTDKLAYSDCLVSLLVESNHLLRPLALVTGE